MESPQSKQKSSPASTRVEQLVQCGGKKSETKDSRRAWDTAEVNPDKEACCKKNKSRNEARRHRPTDHIGTNPWQESIRRLRAEAGDDLERLLAQNPAGMETNRKEERSRALCGISEEKPRDKKG